MSTDRGAPGSTLERSTERRTIVDRILLAWEYGGPVSARAAIDAHPVLATDRSVIIELAYEEYRRKLEEGEDPDRNSFCRQFPEVENSLLEVLAVDSILSVASHDGEDEAKRAWPQIGEPFLGFQILSELGRGAFSRVYLAQQSSIGDRHVALKVSQHEIHEADKLGRLDHPHIVPVYSLHRDEGSDSDVLCMPYLGRATLAAALDGLHGVEPDLFDARVFYVDPQSCPGATWDDIHVEQSRVLSDNYVNAVLQIGAALADALQYAHDQGILHLDLKPSNVLLGFDGRPLLLDFNLSVTMGEERRRLGGTLPYMAPEVLRAVTGQADAAAIGPCSDVYALGIVLYELLTGKHPFSARKRKAALPEGAVRRLEEIDASVVPIQKWNPAVDSETASTIERCLQADPADRPNSAGELARRLRAGLSPSRRLRRQALQHRRLVRLLGAATLIAAVAIAGWWAQRDPYEVRQYQAGMQALAAGSDAEALAYFERALPLQPENPEFLTGYGTALTKLERFDEAESAFRSARRQRPSPLCDSGLIYVLEQLGRHDEALAVAPDLDTALKLDTAALNNLGSALLAKKRWDEAKQMLDAARHRSDAPAIVHYNRARLDANRLVQERTLNSTDGLVSARRAIEMGLSRGQVFRHAALLAAAASKNEANNAALDDEVRRNLRLALEHGISLPMLKGTEFLAPYCKDESLAAVQPLPNEVLAPIDGLVSPF